MKKFLFFICFVVILLDLVISAQFGDYNIKIRILEGEWVMFENCESKFWKYPGDWGWNRYPSELTWGNFFNRDCLQVTSTDTTKNALVLQTATFPLENWQNVELIRMDVYVEFPDNTADLKIEPKDKNGNSIEAIYYYDIPAGQWVDCVWDIDQSSSGYQYVRQIFLIPDSLGTNPATFYFDNLRLILTDGTTYYWDRFDSPSKIWSYLGDAYAYYDNGYQTTESAITWSGSTSTVNTGRIFMLWSADKDNSNAYAKVESCDLNDIDFSRYARVRIDVLCSTTTAKIAVGFWDGSNWDQTSTLTVSSTDTYHILEFTMPRNNSNFNWGSVNNVSILVTNTDEVTSGEVYIDDIRFLK